MPSKYRIILEMASQTARDIASNADRYTDFLITAANNYKYSFKEQLLIHAQKPDATACAEIDTWNKLGRWVNKGTKGIALLIDRDVPYKLRHVFDISDTNSRAGRNITLWQMKPEYEYAVSESLQASFGDVEEPRDFPHLLIDISGYAVEDNLSDYLMELNAVKAGSFLEELDDTGLNNAFDDILDQAEEMRESVEDEQDFDLGATLYRPLSQGIDNVLSIYASEDDNLFATAMIGWGKQAGLNPEMPTKTGLIEFRESSFSVNAAKQSLFIPPDWKRYSNTSIVRREGKILGSFDRGTAATREDILFFAPGDAVYDSIISNAVGCNRGRCTGIETTGIYNYDGLVYIYNIAPELDELLENEMPMQTLAQYKMYLPLRQIFVAMPLNIKSKEIPEKEVVKTLLALRPNNAGHVGRRSAGRLSISPLERFISRTPPSTWAPLVDK